jgi:hypothetical protein
VQFMKGLPLARNLSLSRCHTVQTRSLVPNCHSATVLLPQIAAHSLASSCQFLELPELSILLGAPMAPGAVHRVHVSLASLASRGMSTYRMPTCHTTLPDRFAYQGVQNLENLWSCPGSLSPSVSVPKAWAFGSINNLADKQQGLIKQRAELCQWSGSALALQVFYSK